MLIDKFIQSETLNQKSGGSNKKCWLFDEYALLYGSFKEDEIKQVSQIGNRLESEGVFILPTMEYKIDTPPNMFGYVKGYSLQKRARGRDLYQQKMTQDEYMHQLQAVASMTPRQTEKFVSDWLKIEKAGLMIDPSKCENFFYDNGNISFIDLNLSKKPTPTKTSFLYAFGVLTGLGLRFKYKSDEANLHMVKIAKTLAQSFVKRGMSIDEARAVLSGNSGLPNKKDVEQVIGFLTAQKQASMMSLEMNKNGR